VHQQVDLDEKTLKKVAETGGGKYFRASDSRELSEIYDLIDQAEKTEVKVKEFFILKSFTTTSLFRRLYYSGWRSCSRPGS